MNAIASSLAVVVALSAVPALAHEGHGAPLPPPAPQAVAPWAPAAPPAPYAAPVPAPPAHVHPGYAPVPLVRTEEWAPRWGHQLRQLQGEYRRLERERDRFYASWRGNPFAQRRFERWYGERRAELDRRYAWLAERRERRGADGRFAWSGREHRDD